MSRSAGTVLHAGTGRQRLGTMQPMREPQHLGPGLRRRRGAVLVLLTLVLPGSAQLLAGSRRAGRAALRVWLGVLAAIAVAGVLWAVDRTVLFAVVTRPWSLLLLMVLLVVGAVWWALLFLDAWRLANPRRLRPGAGRGVGILAAVLAVVTAGPMLYGASLMSAQRDLISDVFGSGTTSEPVDGRYNVLLLGGDAGQGRVGMRPDSITLASIDADTGSTVLFALPRNLQEVPFAPGTPAAQANPEGFSCGDECLLNAVYTYGVEHPEEFPGGGDPGATAMKQAVEGITGLHVNYYVLVELKGFQGIIDAMGGIRMDVGRRVPIGGGTDPVKGYIEPGEQVLDGYHALWFARSRHESSDYERMARQRCVMAAMASQMDPQTLLTRFQEIAAASKDLVATDIPDEDLDTFVDLGLEAKAQDITSVQFVPPLITPSDPDYTVVRQAVTAAIAADEGNEPDAGGDDEAGAGAGSPAPAPAEPAPADPADPADEAAPEAPADAPAVDARVVCRAG